MVAGQARQNWLGYNCSIRIRDLKGMLMPLVYDYLFPAMWLSFLAYWWAISRNVKETERQESAASRLTRLVLIICAAALLWLPSVPLPLLNERFLPDGAWRFWSGAPAPAGDVPFDKCQRRHGIDGVGNEGVGPTGNEFVTSGPYA